MKKTLTLALAAAALSFGATFTRSDHRQHVR